MTVVSLPASLRGVFPPARWDVTKLWTLDTEAEEVPTAELWWCLELCVWPSAPPERLFDLSPSEVLREPERYPRSMARIFAADLSYPLELYDYRGRFVLIDGYHRLARLRLEGASRALVRRHPASIMKDIARDP
ncbi:MAG: hypothetical protein OEZ06_03520 [Myxococcales bacterium]|nr:hypothetical protein [Myxococcales bacterium]